MLCLWHVVGIALHIHTNFHGYYCVVIAYLLPEAICCYLQTCYVYGVLLTLQCTYIPSFMATTANIRVHLVYLLPEAICCCLQSCCVSMLLLIMCYMCIPSFNIINLLAA